jgi:16S rRNA (cytosine1402-N4)-methyltransferase
MAHIPVLLTEMLDALSPQDNEIYIDATFGGGGYTKAILNKAFCKVIAFDRDPEAIERGQELLRQYPERLILIQAPFSEMEEKLYEIGIYKVHGIVYDLGVSSFQIDQAERGFSFRFEGPLDMRMSAEGMSAADVVNAFSEKELADIIYYYGEEKQSRRIARAIVQERTQSPIQTTGQLATLISRILKRSPGAQHPATLTFQALRIFVNNELIEIDRSLSMSHSLLVPGGRLVVITFHSLEDRLVKNFLKKSLEYPEEIFPGHHFPKAQKPFFQLLTRKPIEPSEEEVRLNPRSRSAKLRAAIRTDVCQGNR